MHNEGTTETGTLNAVLSRENLQAAWLAVKANQGAAGVDGMDIEQTEAHLKEHWANIERKLREGTYRPAAVRSMEIPKPHGGTRTLGIPNVQDRLIHQAIHQHLAPLWEAEFSPHSHGFRANHSAHDAIREAQGFIEAGKTWVVDIDLKNFFDEVNHDILMRRIGEKVKDKALLRLIGDYLRAPMQTPDGRKTKRGKGTPQGGPLSPLLANIYLDPLDKELERRGVSFVRYADDIAIFASSERSAARILESVIAWIEKNLKLPVNREKSRSGPADESGLLGFRLYTDGRVGIAPKAIARMKDRVRDLWDARQSRTSNELRDQWKEYITGWWNYFNIATRRWEVEDLSGWIRRHMRKCFWIRWKTPRGRINALKRLGVKGRALGIGYTGLGAWAVAKSRTLHHALNNTTLNNNGFIVPWDFAEAQ
ncbi:MAG: group II intron reverse transcriptase/maturase [Phycisphaerales bacterium]|nr:group II intron reverse transcriptase/maturase [Phycisphaerales bacterium]